MHQGQSQGGSGEGGAAGNPDLLEGDLDANLGMNDDDLLGDFGDDFNILEFADALDGNDTNKTNILDDLEAEDSKDGEKDEAKPPPYIGGVPPQPQPGQAAPGQQQPPADPSRPPPPPYPGQQKVSPQSVAVNWVISVCPFIYLSYYFSFIHFLRELI